MKPIPGKKNLKNIYEQVGCGSFIRDTPTVLLVFGHGGPILAADIGFRKSYQSPLSLVQSGDYGLAVFSVQLIAPIYS